MILTRSREFTVNMGNYESCKIGASVAINTDDMKPAEGELTMEQVYAVADDLLDQALASDLNEARELTHTEDSFVLSWKRK